VRTVKRDGGLLIGLENRCLHKQRYANVRVKKDGAVVSANIICKTCGKRFKPQKVELTILED